MNAGRSMGNMNFSYIKNKKIAILGLGIENYALVKYLLKHKIKCEITICDKQKNIGAIHKLPQRDNIHWQLGKNFNKKLKKFDILFRSPGWPITPFLTKDMTLSSPIKLFFQLCPTKNIIGVSGTKGKGTTASLIYKILKAAGKRVWLGGNIGVAPFEFIDKIKKNDWTILELSSFQLEDMKVSPHISVITNLSPEHLAAADPNNPNYHKNLKSYYKAKLNIVKWQNEDNKAILNYELRIKNNKLKSKVLTFSGRNKKADCYWLNNNKIKFHNSIFIIHTSLPGDHNKENIAAAVLAAKTVGINNNIIKTAVADFKGLEHRLEYVRTLNKVKYYNDSFATTPESTIIALNSFNEPIVLLAGGAEKKSNFKKLAKIIKQKVKFLVLLNGQATPRIKKEITEIGFPDNKIRLAHSINKAVRLAKENTSPGDIVLLSTACASFGMFKNYKERGKLFKKIVKKLK